MYTCVHAKEGGQHGKVRGNIDFKTNDYLWAVHESWCHVKPLLALNIQPQDGQGTWGGGREDRMTNINEAPSGW